MVGFRANNPAPSLLTGKTLQLKLNGGATQTFTFDGTTPSVDKINATITGGRAYLSVADNDYFFVRSDIRESPGSVQIVGGTALADLGLVARVITEKSEDLVLATVPALLDPDVLVTFEDEDGVLQDYYAITTIDSLSNESLKTSYRQPITSTGPVCVLEGLVIDLQGIRIPDAEVIAKLVRYPHSPETATHVTLAPVTTLSGPDGRFSLVVLQGALIQLEVPVLGFAKNITVPAKSYEFITDLTVDLDYRFPLGTEV
jgi:hypothetical protein